MWVFQSAAGEVSWMGDASEADAEAIRAKLEDDTWGSPTIKRRFRAEDRDQVEAEVRGAKAPGRPWWRRQVRERGV